MIQKKFEEAMRLTQNKISTSKQLLMGRLEQNARHDSESKPNQRRSAFNSPSPIQRPETPKREPVNQVTQFKDVLSDIKINKAAFSPAPKS